MMHGSGGFSKSSACMGSRSGSVNACGAGARIFTHIRIHDMISYNILYDIMV